MGWVAVEGLEGFLEALAGWVAKAALLEEVGMA